MRRPFRFGLLFALVLTLLTLPAMLAQPNGSIASSQKLNLWPHGVPGFKTNLGPERYEADLGHILNVSRPMLEVLVPEHPNGTAVVVCPGGSYVMLAYPKEGIEPAQWLNRHGVTAFVLKYRLGEYGQPAPLQDVLQAIRTVRSLAKQYHLDPQRIGVLGFSAGGHLAASAGTLFNDPQGRTGSELDSVSGRPDFMMLIYPVITLKDDFAHKGSYKALLGDNPSAELVNHWSLDQQVTPQTPPAFIVATEEDKVVPVMNSIQFYQALLKAQVPAELHLYQKGSHGFALRLKDGPTAHWPDRAIEWMTSHGWLPAAAPQGK